MQEPGDAPRGGSIALVTVELVVAVLIVAVASLVVVDSLRVGAGWADDGPQAGYFPFYVGLMLGVSGVAAGIAALRHRPRDREAVFVTHGQLVHVLEVLVPTAVYALAIALLGIYVASAAFVAWFMTRHSEFRWPTVAAVSIGVPIALFLVFERWFLVPLPKGPLEAALGL